jgi:hypothetical protein
VVVDDTLGHQRGATVAFGGIFLDAVLRSKRYTTFRFGTNGVRLGLVVSMPVRRDRFFGLPLWWRVDEKRGAKPEHDHRTQPALAADAVRTLAEWRPGRKILVIADRASIGKGRLRDRPENVESIGPVGWHAARTEVHAGPDGGRRSERSARTTGVGRPGRGGSACPAGRASGCTSRGWRRGGRR